MRKQTFSVTGATRNFADCVSRVQKHNVTLALLKNRSLADRLVPQNEKVGLGRDFAWILADVKLSDEESAAWQRDLKATRGILKRPAAIGIK